MTREEAISFLIKDKEQRGDCFISEAVDMAIKALEQEPCEDCISREAFITRYREWSKSEYGKIPSDDALGLRVAKSLPSIQPKPKMGHWIHFASGDDCSECGWSTGRYISPSKYCPGCGCLMVEPQAESE